MNDVMRENLEQIERAVNAGCCGGYVFDQFTMDLWKHIRSAVENDFQERKVLQARLEIADPDGESLDMLYDEDGNFINYG